MNVFGRGLSTGEVDKLLEEAQLSPVWVGSSEPGNLSGHVIILDRNEYGELKHKHRLVFDSQAGYNAYKATLNAAFRAGYQEAKARLFKAV